MNELIGMFAKVNGVWRFEGFAASVDFCKEVGKKVEEENGYDTFRSFRIED